MGAPYEIRRILVATDFGPVSRRAVDVALDIAAVHGASVLLLHTFEVPDFGPVGSRSYADQQRAQASERLAELAREASAGRDQLRMRTEAREGTAWEQIDAAARADDVDLVVVGTHGRRGLPRALLGSVAEKVVRTSKVPVLTVRGDDDEETAP